MYVDVNAIASTSAIHWYFKTKKIIS